MFNFSAVQTHLIRSFSWLPLPLSYVSDRTNCLCERSAFTLHSFHSLALVGTSAGLTRCVKSIFLSLKVQDDLDEELAQASAIKHLCFKVKND